MKKKICDHCKEPYKKKAEVVTVFGNTFCLHDELLEAYAKLRGLPMRSNPELKVKEAKWGNNKTEQNYIERAHSAGDVVVRGSDNQLRRIGRPKK